MDKVRSVYMTSSVKSLCPGPLCTAHTDETDERRGEDREQEDLLLDWSLNINIRRSCEMFLEM